MGDIRIVTEGKSVSVQVEKGTEVYDPDSGKLFEVWTGSEAELEAASKQAAKDEADRAKNTKAAAAAAAKAEKAEAARVAAAGV